jgi:hypothetical protein
MKRNSEAFGKLAARLGPFPETSHRDPSRRRLLVIAVSLM